MIMKQPMHQLQFTKGWYIYEEYGSKGSTNGGWRFTLEKKKEFGYIVIMHATCIFVPPHIALCASLNNVSMSLPPFDIFFNIGSMKEITKQYYMNQES
jgi:hypothetical protein